jgi:uncharacterized oligopeptide transporter (OPT) family protein
VSLWVERIKYLVAGAAIVGAAWAFHAALALQVER